MSMPTVHSHNGDEKRTYVSTSNPTLHLNQTTKKDCESGSSCPATDPNHRACHNSRSRRFLIPIFIALIGLGALITMISCTGGTSGIFSRWAPDGGTLIRRAGETAAATATASGPFVNKKLYLIIIFVGLFLVVLAAIMLSAWCCKGAFENPLCCPCYLCACCGGLACLECIGCGLCAEGFVQVAQDG